MMKMSNKLNVDLLFFIDFEFTCRSSIPRRKNKYFRRE